MPQRVVDVLEAVDIHVQQGDLLGISGQRAECLAGAVAEQVKVGQAGQVVVERQGFHLLFGTSSLADFTDQLDIRLLDTGDEYHPIDHQAGQHLIGMAEQLVDIMGVAVGGEAQLRKDRNAYRQ